MANIKSAKKRARQATKNREHNMGLRSRMRTLVKKVLAAVQAGDKKAANDVLKPAAKAIDGMSNKGLIHKNKAARSKSRLNAKVKAL